MKKWKLCSIIAVFVLLLSSTIALLAGGGIFGFAKNDIEKEESVQEGTNTSAATAPTNNSYWDESVSRVDTDWSGSGTQADPWLITSAAELAGLSYSIYNNTKSSYLTSSLYYYSGCYFKQTVDIDVSVYYWRPIGTSSRYFSGNYDGDGHTVSGVFTKASLTIQGLFGRTYGQSATLASIQSIGVVDSYIQGKSNVGGITGDATWAKIVNCYNSSAVSGTTSIGGITGNSADLTITNCFNTATISGTTQVGGIIGYIASSKLINSFNAGAVSGTTSVGGIAGELYSSTISQAYYGGNCTLTKGVGTGSGSTTKDASLITNAKTLSWYQDSTKWNSTYPWDFNDIWEIRTVENDGYPVFRIKTWNDYAATSFDSGSGTASSPYIIKTPEQLAYLSVIGQSQEITGNYKLGANIDLSGHEWCPIGVGQTYRFRGVFDGDYYSISNMTIDIKYEHAGLFATVYGTGVVKNLIMKNAVINKGVHTGAITGLNDGGGNITNCVVENCVVNASLYAGGICGWLWSSHIYNTVVKESTMTGSRAGGIFGYQGGTGQCTLTNNGGYGNTITSGGTTGALYGGTANSVLNLNGSYAQGIVNNANSKLMYGDSTAWANWTYNAMLNGGYPVQTTLFHIGGLSGSTNVYNYLKNTLGFTVA